MIMDAKKIIAEWAEENGVKFSAEAGRELERDLDRAAEEFGEYRYAEGRSDGADDAKDDLREEAEYQFLELVENVELALSLVDSDRASAKVYLDRARNGLSFSLPKKAEAAQCLL